MKVGFTGTRNGMTGQQKKAFKCVLAECDPVEAFHYGSCVGADIQAAQIVRYQSKPGVRIISRPGASLHKVNEFLGDSGVDDKVLPAKTHFARNRDIVDASDLLIGCPGATEWQNRGGTFYTMDYAIKRGKPVRVIWPDGRVENR